MPDLPSLRAVLNAVTKAGTQRPLQKNSVTALPLTMIASGSFTGCPASLASHHTARPISSASYPGRVGQRLGSVPVPPVWWLKVSVVRCAKRPHDFPAHLLRDIAAPLLAERRYQKQAPAAVGVFVSVDQHRLLRAGVPDQNEHPR